VEWRGVLEWCVGWGKSGWGDTKCAPVYQLGPLPLMGRRPWEVKLGKLPAAPQVHQILIHLPEFRDVLRCEEQQVWRTK